MGYKDIEDQLEKVNQAADCVNESGVSYGLMYHLYRGNPTDYRKERMVKALDALINDTHKLRDEAGVLFNTLCYLDQGGDPPG